MSHSQELKKAVLESEDQTPGDDLLNNQYWSDRLFVKEYKIPSGMTVIKHTHPYGHLSYLVSGMASVMIEDEEKVLTGPTGIHIDKEKVHAVTALNDCVWLCINNTEEYL